MGKMIIYLYNEKMKPLDEPFVLKFLVKYLLTILLPNNSSNHLRGHFKMQQELKCHDKPV